MTGAVDVWSLPLCLAAGELAALAATLAPDEQERAARLRADGGPARFVAARGQMRRVLAGYLGQAPAAVRFHYSAYGKPDIAGDAGAPPLRFNLAHAGEWAVLAVSRGRALGVDIEQLRPLPDAAQIAARFFAPEESAAWAALPAAEQPAAFFRCWTRKEACVKVWGTGLAQPLDRFVVSLAPGSPARLLALDGDPAAAGRWVLCDLEGPPGYVAALAVEGHDWQLVPRSLSETLAR